MNDLMRHLIQNGSAPTVLKTCIKCLQKKPIAEFYRAGREHKAHWENRCKKCNHKNQYRLRKEKQHKWDYLDNAKPEKRWYVKLYE